MQTPADDSRHRSRRTTPTWEVELLISGVAVFAMLQLPGLLDDGMLALRERFDEGWRELLLLGFLYAKSAALILALTFVLHLMLRARWIALVGIHSVYPEGVRWDRLRLGPILREVEQARMPPFPVIIERADNRATTVFAMGVMLAFFVLVIATGAIAICIFSLLVSALSHGRIGMLTVLLLLIAIAMVPYSLALLVDRTRGARLPRDGRLHRLLQRTFRGYTRLGFSRGSNPVMALLGSHDGDRRITWLTTLLIFLALMLASISLALQDSPGLLGSYGQFPAARGLATANAAHYDDQRNPARDPATPFIPSMMVRTPYLPLRVPYRPNRDAAAMQQHCAHARRLGTELAQAQAQLACLSALHAVSLDGKPLAGLRFEISSDPRTERPALLAMIDVRTLPQGRHELRIARPARADSVDKDDPGFDRILFWR